MSASTFGPSITIEPFGLRIPWLLANFERFREWSTSEEFPEKGRIDWIDGDLEVDMVSEEANSHGEVKAAISGDLRGLITNRDLGVIYIDSMRVVAPSVGLSVEPDVVVVLFSSLESGRVRLVEATTGRAGRFMELEGAPDLVVECVSDSSVAKDTERLRERYFAAGIPEYWIADSRGPVIRLEILLSGAAGYERASPDADGFAHSRILGRSVRLVRKAPRLGVVRHGLEIRPA